MKVTCGIHYCILQGSLRTLQVPYLFYTLVWKKDGFLTYCYKKARGLFFGSFPYSTLKCGTLAQTPGESVDKRQWLTSSNHPEELRVEDCTSFEACTQSRFFWERAEAEWPRPFLKKIRDFVWPRCTIRNLNTEGYYECTHPLKHFWTNY